MTQEYQARYPGREAKGGICSYTEAGIEILAGFPNSGFYALAGIYPALRTYIDPRDLRNGVAPEDIVWRELLPAWWLTFEKFIWSMAEHAPHGPVPYCRIHPQP